MVENNQMKKGVIIGFLVILIIVGGAALMFKSSPSSGKRAEIDTFAQCLTKNNVTMYGAFWCPKCAATKKSFGVSFRYIQYVECDPRGENEQSELCIIKNIDKYDTWEFSDGTRIVGTPTFASLGEKSGCSVPGADNGN